MIFLDYKNQDKRGCDQILKFGIQIDAFLNSKLGTKVKFSLIIFCLILLTNQFKLISIDEFLQFAYGSLRDLDEFLRVVVNSAQVINHNQTGIYSLFNYLMLSNFDVNTFSLRGPSFIAGLLVIIFLYTYLKSLRLIAFNSILLYLMFMLSFFTIFQFMAEGRPYIVLSLSCLGIFLFFYSLLVHEINFNKIFYASVIVGSLFHPYLILYLIFFSFIFLILFALKSRVKDIMYYLIISNLLSFIINVILYSYVWGTNSIYFSGFDPFQFTNGFWYFIPLLLAGNFSPITFSQLTSGQTPLFISSFSIIFYLLFIVVLVIFILRNRSNAIIKLNLFLVLATFLFSFLLSAVSLYFNYWILTRQWVGSLIIIVFCLINISIELFNNETDWILKKMGQFSICLLFLFQVMYYTHINVSNYYIKMQVEKSDIIKLEMPLNNTDDYIRLSNMNLTFGGPIYPQFRDFYQPYLKRTKTCE